MPRFLIYHPSEGSRVYELIGDRPVSIGRAKSSSLILDNPSISRLHAVVRSTPDGKWQIIDRGAANPVKVNGTAAKETTLRPNDEILVGEYRLRYFEDSTAGEMVAYGTPELPPRITKVMSESAYSGSFMSVQSVSSVASFQPEKSSSPDDRMRSLERENRLLTLLYRVNRALGEARTTGDVTKRILDLVLEIDGAERAFVMLLDKDSIGRGDFSRGGYGFEPAVLRHRASGKAGYSPSAPQLTISQSIIRQVMHGGLPLLVSDPKADPRLAASKSIADAGIQSAMCAPLGIKERRFGLLYVDNLSRRGMFTVDELNVFAVIAAQAGLAIDRSRTGEEVSEQPAVTQAIE